MKFLHSIEERPRLVLLLILLTGLALRLALLPVRWINPDEGTHLMDARLLVQGLVPLVDYGSKQPFYIALLALAIKVFGAHLWVGRLLVLLCQVATAWVLYAIAAHFISRGVGRLVAALYSLWPFIAIWGPVVKTEPLAILLAAVSVYLFMIGIIRIDKLTSPLFWAGVVAGLDYYVRQSTLFLPLITLIFVVIYRGASCRFRLASLLIYGSGFMSIPALAILLYSRWMPIEQILFSPLNPLELVFSRGLHVLGLAPPQYRISDSSGFRIMDQPVSMTLAAWQDSLLLSLFIVLALVWCFYQIRRTIRGVCHSSRFGYLTLWLVVVLLMYVFQSLQRGFFSQYFIEILTPGLLLLTVMLEIRYRITDREALNYLLLAFPAFFICMALARVSQWQQLPMSWNFWVALLLFMVTLRQRPTWRWLTGIAIGAGLQWLTTALALPVLVQILLILGLFFAVIRIIAFDWKRKAIQGIALLAFWLTAAYSGVQLGPRYESVWSPATLKEVKRILQPEEKTSTVLAGTSIWAFESGLQPYLNIAHPTEVQRKFRTDFAEKMAQQPPDFIILDGYTQRKYNRYWPLIEQALHAQYERVASLHDAKYPVEVYRLLSTTAQPMKTFT